MAKKIEPDLMEKIVSLCKRRGFIFQGSEIYGGLAGTWDYGPLGVALKKNIENLWWRMFVKNRDDMYGVDAAILMNSEVWETSGHVEGFHDPLVECSNCGRRYRGDQVGLKCPNCGGEFGPARQFNMMFKTFIGADSTEEYQPGEPEYDRDEGGGFYVSNVIPEKHSISYEPESLTYLRPETAGGIFVNFKNIVDTFHPKLPLCIAQIRKAFRNEIAPRDFIFRVREFEQMEIEYFVRPDAWKESFEEWRKGVHSFVAACGIPADAVHELEVPDGDRAHYSKRTIDFEFDYPFGRKELYGLAYRTDFDLSAHSKGSSVELSYLDEETKEKLTPHVIEPSFGVERTMLAVLLSAYREDELGGEKRTYLALKPGIAPIDVAVFPLLKNKPDLVRKAREIYQSLKAESSQLNAVFDDNGNIGKRYRRQDEIGTPYCITVDFDTLENDSVTVRDRDSGEQERISIQELKSFLSDKIKAS